VTRRLELSEWQSGWRVSVRAVPDGSRLVPRVAGAAEGPAGEIAAAVGLQQATAFGAGPDLREARCSPVAQGLIGRGVLIAGDRGSVGQQGQPGVEPAAGGADGGGHGDQRVRREPAAEGVVSAKHGDAGAADPVVVEGVEVVEGRGAASQAARDERARADALLADRAEPLDVLDDLREGVAAVDAAVGLGAVGVEPDFEQIDRHGQQGFEGLVGQLEQVADDADRAHARAAQDPADLGEPRVQQRVAEAGEDDTAVVVFGELFGQPGDGVEVVQFAQRCAGAKRGVGQTWMRPS